MQRDERFWQLAGERAEARPQSGSEDEGAGHAGLLIPALPCGKVIILPARRSADFWTVAGTAGP
jgi:hypothetical protein